jgi:hypothetical protein
MTRTSAKRSMTALVMTAALAVPGASAARTPTERFVPDGPDAGQYCGKDYSQNSVTGDFCVRLRATVASSPQGVAKDGGSSWDGARIGGIGALALVVAAASSAEIRRRRSAASTTASPGSPATT